MCKEGRRYIYAQEFHRYLVSLPNSSSLQGDRLGNRFLQFGLNYIHLFSSDGIKMIEKLLKIGLLEETSFCGLMALIKTLFNIN